MCPRYWQYQYSLLSSPVQLQNLLPGTSTVVKPPPWLLRIIIIFGSSPKIQVLKLPNREWNGDVQIFYETPLLLFVVVVQHCAQKWSNFNTILDQTVWMRWHNPMISSRFVLFIICVHPRVGPYPPYSRTLFTRTSRYSTDVLEYKYSTMQRRVEASFSSVLEYHGITTTEVPYTILLFKYCTNYQYTTNPQTKLQVSGHKIQQNAKCGRPTFRHGLQCRLIETPIATTITIAMETIIAETHQAHMQAPLHLSRWRKKHFI